VSFMAHTTFLWEVDCGSKIRDICTSVAEVIMKGNGRNGCVADNQVKFFSARGLLLLNVTE
jgi:hypothetical protein